MEIKNIKLSILDKKYREKLNLSNIKKNARLALSLPSSVLGHPEKHNLSSLSDFKLNSLRIKDLYKDIRHRLNFDDETLSINDFLEVYGEKHVPIKKTQHLHGKDRLVSELRTSLGIIDNYICRHEKYIQYQEYNLNRLLNLSMLNSVKEDPALLSLWKEEILRIMENTRNIQGLISEVCVENPYITEISYNIVGEPEIKRHHNEYSEAATPPDWDLELINNALDQLAPLD